MPAVPQRFSKAAKATAGPAGTAQVTFSPPMADWVVVHVSVSTVTAVLQPVASLYLNGTDPDQFLEGSYSGSQDDSDTRHLLQPGDTLYVVWTGADVGTICTARITVIQYDHGRAPLE